MKKVLCALTLLAVSILPGCGGDNGCNSCGKSEVNVQTYNKSAGNVDSAEMPDIEANEESDMDEYEL